MIRSHRDELLIWALLALLGYVFVAQSVFALRHPWATDTERFLYFGRALVFGKVDYSDARPRE